MSEIKVGDHVLVYVCLVPLLCGLEVGARFGYCGKLSAQKAGANVGESSMSPEAWLGGEGLVAGGDDDGYAAGAG